MIRSADPGLLGPGPVPQRRHSTTLGAYPIRARRLGRWRDPKRKVR
ncbi:MAG: hypothetical protein AVDCRST_MAG08-4459 [uncultured Acetobacteraceae bacterium]|uniref:Uncharacterized protein n=1 Tax=uncultured Acetobacteraceae bacterium TaxID=169975 RepID=A0A6J4JW02_9PROT|nr:MAG: hypothetical protein AVDCRST_MAG08-4459 [uncultured Acetobacteraceae bacterium]